jgi:acetolactate synthase-1/2/3 large subunit
MVGADRRLARAQEPLLSRKRHRDHAAARDRLYQATPQGKDRIITTEVGQHQMWAAQHLALTPQPLAHLRRARHHGLWLPGRIGAQMGNPDSLVI